jgi:integrase
VPTTKLTKAVIERAEVPEKGFRILWDSGVKGFGLVLHAPSPPVHPGGKKSFVCRFRTHTGHDHRMVLGTFGELTVDQARALAQDALATVRRGGDPLCDRRAQRAAAEAAAQETVADVFRRWHAAQVGFGRWKASTSEEIERLFDVDVLPVIGGRPIGALSRGDVQRVLERKAGARYVYNRLRTWLSALLAWAEREELRPLGSNPCATIERHVERRRERALSLDELAHVGAGLRALEDESDPAAAVLRLLALTGLRKREATRLRWQEVDLAAGALRLADTKTGARVKVLSKPARALLEARGPQADGLVFPSARKPSTPVEELRDVIETACAAREGAPAVPVFTAHTLRHTYATLATSKARINPLVLSLLLGHRKKADTTAGYVHVSPDDEIVREAEERVGALIANALAGKVAGVVALDARRGGA